MRGPAPGATDSGMTSIAHKLRSAAFYLGRPPFWAHFGHRALGYLHSAQDSRPQKAYAAGWAQARAQPLGVVLAHFGLTPDGIVPRMPMDVMAEARHRVAGAPVRMGGGAHVDLLYAVTRLTGARRILETGVAFGWSSLAFLSGMERNGGGRLVSVDRPYPGDNSEIFIGLAVPEHLAKHWAIVREPDRNGLLKAAGWFPHGADIAHYDSDKTYRGRQFGYPVMWRALRPGGLFISDDIQDNLAFAHFVERARASYGVVESAGKYVGIALKPGLRPAVS